MAIVGSPKRGVAGAGSALEPGSAAPDKSSGGTALDLVQKALEWAYGAALGGVAGGGAVEDFVAEYRAGAADTEAAIDTLVRWQVGKAGTAGFVTGLGGLLTLPAAIPANLAGVMYIQLRLIAAVATLRGYDVHSDRVRTLCIACLAGSAGAEVLKDVGIKVGTRLTEAALARVTGATLVRINQAVGFRLVTRSGSAGLVNLSRMVPFVGGIVGGSFDAATTLAIAKAARAMFPARGAVGE